MPRYKKPSVPKPAEIQAWFAANAGTMRVVYEMEGPGTLYVSENETYYLAPDGTGLLCTVDYSEGCPTCGGAYVKEWQWYPHGVRPTSAPSQTMSVDPTT